MSKTIAILATLDTKMEECVYLKEQIIQQGGNVLLLDISVVDDAPIDTDVTAADMASAGGTSLSELRINPSREVASEVMVRGAKIKVKELLSAKKIDGIISLGGTQGTANCAQVMQTLPYGFPKVIVSTMASGDTSNYVGIKDITMMFSVSDILGLNPLFRSILANAAGAVVGMANASHSFEIDPSKSVIGITNLGVLTQGTMHAMKLFAEQGYETMVFHAVGSGGSAMEQLMREGIITAVFDYALGDMVDAVGGGIRAADEQRMTVAAELGLPQVVVPGGTDHLGILVDEANHVPEQYSDRKYTFHNPVIFVPRTNMGELAPLAATVAERLNAAKGPVKVLLPTLGLSSYSVADGPLADSDCDKEFFEAIKSSVIHPISTVDASAEAPEFVEQCVESLITMIKEKSTK